MADDIDPLLNLAYAPISEQFTTHFGRDFDDVRRKALHYMGTQRLLVNGVKKELIVLVSCDGLLLVKLSGLVARYVPFSKVCEMATNVDAIVDKYGTSVAGQNNNATGGPPNLRMAPFLLLTLLQCEPFDLVFVADEGALMAPFVNALLSLWSVNRSYPQIKITVKSVMHLSELGIPHRTPKSSRNFKPDKPTLSILPVRSQRYNAFFELCKRQKAEIDLFVADQEKRAFEVRRLRKSASEALAANPQSSEDAEKEGPRLQVITPRTEKFIQDAIGAEAEKDILPTERKPRGSLKADGPLGKTQEDPDEALRSELPQKLGDFRRSHTVAFTAIETRDAKTGAPYAFIPTDFEKKFPSFISGKRERKNGHALLFFDQVYVSSTGPNLPLVKSFLYFCPQRLYIADSEAKVRLCVNISDISNFITINQLKGISGAEHCSEGALLMLREDMFDIFVGFLNPGRRDVCAQYLSRATASSDEPTTLNIDACTSLDETGCNLGGNDTWLEAGTFKPPSLKPINDILPPSEHAARLFPMGEFPLTPEMRKDSTRLEEAWVLWAGYVNFYVNPYPSKKKTSKPDLHHRALMYVSTTHIFLVNLTTLRDERIIHAHDISRIDVQSLKYKGATDARRQRYVIVCATPEYDVCVEHDWEEESQRSIAAILEACRKCQGAGDKLPMISPIDDIPKNKYRFFPLPGYVMPKAPELPVSDSFLRNIGTFRNKIARYFVRNDPARIKDALELAKNNHKKQDEFFDSLVAKYKITPEKNRHIADYGGRLERLFAKYSPENLTRIPLLLDRGRGAEEEMIFRLVQKFGPEPDLPEDNALEVQDDDNMTRALKKIFAQYEPSEVENARAIREKNYGTEKELMEALRKKYGAAADNPLFEVPELLDKEKVQARPRLRRFCLRYLPEFADDDNVNLLLAKHRGTIEELFRGLVDRHGPEPVKPSQRARDRLRRFLEKYQPGSPTDDDSIDDFFAAFRGTEEDLFAKLVRKFGPEPLPDGAEILDDIQACVDLSRELPYMDIPEEMYERFPSLVNHPRALYWFGNVSHWEPPQVAVIRFAYISATHIFVSEREDDVRRCIPLRAIRAVYINTKRDIAEERQCTVLFQLRSDAKEPDLLLVFATEVEAKTMLWIVAEIIAKQNWGPSVNIVGVSQFDDVDANCSIPPHGLHFDVATIPPRISADHPSHNLRGRLAEQALGLSPTTHDHLYPTAAKGPASPSGEHAFAPAAPSFLELRHSKFGNNTPHYRGLRTTGKPEHVDDERYLLQRLGYLEAADDRENAPMTPGRYRQLQSLRHSRDGVFGNSVGRYMRNVDAVSSVAVPGPRSPYSSSPMLLPATMLRSGDGESMVPDFDLLDDDDDEVTSPRMFSDPSMSQDNLHRRADLALAAQQRQTNFRLGAEPVLNKPHHRGPSAESLELDDDSLL